MRGRASVAGLLAGITIGYALGATTREAKAQAAPSLEDRVAALEAKTQDITRNMSDDGQVPYLQINARVGIQTNYWARQPLYEGAALSVGTIDRFAGYFEVDQAVCPDHPTTAIYASCVAPNSTQPNLAIEAHAKNAPAGTIALFGDSQYTPGSPFGQPVTPIVGQETDGSENVLHTITIGPVGVLISDGSP